MRKTLTSYLEFAKYKNQFKGIDQSERNLKIEEKSLVVLGKKRGGGLLSAFVDI